MVFRFRVGQVSRLALAGILAASAAPLSAQEAAPPPTVEGARSFTPADFARFAPRNALDMLRQVPGFVIREQSQERGIGQATGNILLNGQRISAKSNDILAELSRIPAQNVVRIDIVDGATLNIPGLSGQVANIIAKAAGISGQFAWRPEFRTHFTDPLLTRFEVSASGRQGPVEYTLGLENQASHSGAGGETIVFNADRSLRERRHDVWTGEYQQPRLSGRFAIDGPGSSLGNLSLSYRQFWYDFVEDGTRTGPGLIDRERQATVEENGHNYEMGGDYEFRLGPGRLKLIGLNRLLHYVPDSRATVSFADGRPDIGERFARTGDEKEKIGRAEYRWKAGGADLQISGESAFNSLDIVAQLFELDTAGNFVEIPFPGSTARVEEDRYEVMGSYGRTLSPSLSFQLTAGGEYSQLSQIGGGGLTRTFWRPKGTLTAAWKPEPRLDVNLKLQRRVGQLNFGDFLASVNLTDERENSGNPNLVPPQIWEAEVQAIRNLGAWGTTSLRLYGHLIEDIVDIIPIGATGQSPGNIDRAIRYGAEWKSTVNFDPMGWQGAKLDARLWLQESRLDDPLTGEPRRISNSLVRLIDLVLRHDVPNTDWAWGGGISHELAALSYRLTEVGRQWEGPVWANIYVEHKDVMGLTVRATAGNLLGADSMWDRTLYAGRRTDPISSYERRDRIIGKIFSFSVRGRF
jgi:outer membrane receptor for ferrienterochelin and colicins